MSYIVKECDFKTKYFPMTFRYYQSKLEDIFLSGVAKKAFDEDGFATSFQEVKKFEKLDIKLAIHRERTLARQIGSFNACEKKWRDKFGRPSKRLLCCWAYAFDPELEIIKTEVKK